MAERIPTRTAKAHFSELMTRAETGERFVITRDGRAVAEIGPVAVPEPPSGREPVRPRQHTPKPSPAAAAPPTRPATAQERQKAIDQLLARSTSRGRGLRQDG